jgi:hypothetical protein
MTTAAESGSVVERGEQLFQADGEFIHAERRGYAHGLRGGVILPRGAFDGVDDPAERDAPGVIFLALGQHGAKTVFRRQDIAAEQDGLCRVRAAKNRGGDTSGTRYLVGVNLTVTSGAA